MANTGFLLPDTSSQKKIAIPQNVLTVIIDIKQNEAPSLTDFLTGIGYHIGTNSTVRFQATPSTHFARWVVLAPYLNNGPRLLFSCWYDGTLDDYLRELVANLGDGMDQIWSYCEGYTPGCATDAARFHSFIKQYMITPGFFSPQIFLCAFPGVSAQRIQNCIQLRSAFENILDGVQSQPWLQQIARLLPLHPPVAAVPSTNSKSWLSDFTEKAINWVVGVHPGAVEPNSIVQTKQELFQAEDIVVQNQMTIVSEIKPQILPRIALRIALLVGHMNRPTQFGTFSNLSTIHFARWIIIDNGRNLLFESNYDGSWESYIDDFGDLASLGMNALWGNCIGFPKGGSLDIEAFKKVIRDHQHPAQVFYSAYPDETISNVYKDLKVSEAIETFWQAEGVELFVTGA